jgi:hypothetical protein
MRCDAQRASRVLPIDTQPGCWHFPGHAQVGPAGCALAQASRRLYANNVRYALAVLTPFAQRQRRAG